MHYAGTGRQGIFIHERLCLKFFPTAVSHQRRTCGPRYSTYPRHFNPSGHLSAGRIVRFRDIVGQSKIPQASTEFVRRSITVGTDRRHAELHSYL